MGDLEQFALGQSPETKQILYDLKVRLGKPLGQPLVEELS
jgi:hypothetical protein